MIDKYFVSDVYSHNAEHSLFVESFVEFFSKKNTTFLLNEHHINFVDECNNPMVKAHKFFLNDSFLKWKILRLINREIFKSVYFYIFALFSSLRGRRIVILGVSNFQFFLLSVFLFFTRMKASVVLHGQVESLLGAKKTFSQKLFFLGFRLSKYCKINFLYLSHHIENNIEYSNRNFFCKHPIPLRIIEEIKVSDEIGTEVPFLFHRLKAATVGLIRNDKKNCSRIYDLNVAPSICELSIIGRLHADFNPNYTAGVEHKIWNSIYSDAEFADAVSDVSAFLYFFDDTQYKATASATALDAIVHKKYAVCLKNDAIVSFLDGYPYLIVCNDLLDMSKKLSTVTIKKDRNHELDYFVDTFSLFKQENDLEKWLDNF